MKLSQDKAAITRFVQVFAEQLSKVHGDYVRNTDAKGIRFEFLREVEPSVFASHNAICMKGTYHHCFCLTLETTPPKRYLHSPLTIGGRFDHNYSVNRAFQRDLGRSPTDPVNPLRLSDSHKFRIGADGIIARCTSEAEALLLPHYLALLHTARPVLNALVAFVRRAVPPALRSQHHADSERRLGPLDCDMTGLLHLADSSSAEREAFFEAMLLAKPELADAIRGIRTGEPSA